MLIENRAKPIAIAARMTLRAGTGHKYWSSFTMESARDKGLELSKMLHDLLFEPESDEPLKTVDVPTGGSVSPVDALALLVDFFTIAGNRSLPQKSISQYADDTTGEKTLEILENGLEVLSRITGHYDGSLGLHTAVYFYNDKGKHSKHLFLAIVSLVADKIRNNDSHFFKKFTRSRALVACRRVNVTGSVNI
jgi:hypothetical protein